MGTKADERPTLGDLRRDLKLVLAEEANHTARITGRLGKLMERAFERIESLEAFRDDTRDAFADWKRWTTQTDTEIRSLERKTSYMDQSMLRLLEVRERAATPPDARLPLAPDPEPDPVDEDVRHAIGELRIALEELHRLDGRLENKHKIKAAICVALDHLEKLSE